MSKVITFYNHKGGVAKTTNVFNLAQFIADSGNKVLVVDADPQCNATELLLAERLNEMDEKESTTHEEQILPGTSLLDIMKPRIEGAVPEINIEEIEVINIRDNLDLIKGDVALTSIEDALSEAHSQRHATKTHERRTYCAFGDLLTRFGDKNNYDYILIDLGPSSGALTRSCFLACDAFYIPVNPDRFDVQAISTLSEIIDRWMAEHAEIYGTYKNVGLPIKHGKPQFLGLAIQNLKMVNGRPKPGFKMWVDRIPQKAISNLFPVLQNHSDSDHDLLFNIDSKSLVAAEVPDFGSLAPLMQEFGKAVYSITRDDTKRATETGISWGGATWNDAQRRMEKYKGVYSKMYDRLEWI
ncbi:hypothetical protein MmiEs2_11840 [Methanimicrococcus stummii]|uniref:AAA domain-containing protein n=1 Tax=Methanimicrococcus stummii TaxID=3028294 RepID=A0AA96ZYL6_9EURY|nr:ParA family protein [Methanimicrococcus sp. Es2]WNY28971.1 hypothetical protein MmiEs2_11840 [Methanimicrococcus sp. Es2]